jgi:hypothetical protein
MDGEALAVTIIEATTGDAGVVQSPSSGLLSRVNESSTRRRLCAACLVAHAAARTELGKDRIRGLLMCPPSLLGDRVPEPDPLWSSGSRPQEPVQT